MIFMVLWTTLEFIERLANAWQPRELPSLPWISGGGLRDGESMYVNGMENFVADVDTFYQYIHTQNQYARSSLGLESWRFGGSHCGLVISV